MKSRFQSDLTKFNDFVRGLDDKHRVQVGIFGEKNARSKSAKLTNASLGAIHEFGSFTRGIPARSFLRAPINTHAGDIMKQVAQGAKNLIASGKMMILLKKMGLAAENIIQKAFATHGFGGWAADKPATVRRKGSSSPLIDTGQLRRSIASRVVSA